MKLVEDDEDGEISEPEDPLMLQRDAKDWKVRVILLSFLDTLFCKFDLFGSPT